MIGAPFIDPNALAEALRTFDLPGMWIRPIRFKPTFDKWKGKAAEVYPFIFAIPKRFGRWI